ncbi:kinetochore-associated Ndc80 complex subunit spc25 [Tulasnella sp. JGI-2019a]|nr:kinetochore-associated Ndc80 complex subunit spc25 [Tulasnella sp. JGI-2019a]KAG9011971.1 kinetochore-associated Ndc80 complex subunit spc25 [Tulasnella sp. JGI-2019a]KAG9036256.1 kinetochore-associated Ndc80 complex subunit spc25 [Tulasnella sp. JGI-2019a]
MERHGYKPVRLEELLKGANPTIDTHYNQCGLMLKEFTNAIQSHVAKAKEEIKSRKDSHMKKMVEAEETMKETEKEIHELGLKEAKMIELVKHERAEILELEGHVASLEKQKANTEEEIARREDDIQEVKKKIISRKGVLSRDKEILYMYAKMTAREAQGLQSALGWIVEGVQQDLLLFRFTRIDPEEPEKEFTIVLDISTRSYRVTSSEPLLAVMPTLVDELNASRQFYDFARKLREAFYAHVEEEKRYRGGQ